MHSFWDKLPKPFFALAPMADVTDAAFRHLIALCGAPDVTWTEFVSADGLYHTREVQKMPDSENPLMQNLRFSDIERPIVAQLFSSDPAMLEYGAHLVALLGFDGVDINMGCPDKAVEKQGAGAALMKNPAAARALIRAAKKGASTLPVSVKTRIGYRTNDLVTWLPELLAEEPAAVTVHARTRKELSDVPARWEHVREAVTLRNKSGSSTYIIGNGDVLDLDDARKKVEESGADGAMLGRAVFGNPWLFSKDTKRSEGRNERTLEEKLHTLVLHCNLFETLVPHKSFAVMKKHFKSYVHGFSGAAEARAVLFETKNAREVETCVRHLLETSQHPRVS